MSSSKSPPVIHIGGAIGGNSNFIAGIYDPSTKNRDGSWLFTKRGEDGWCIEHRGVFNLPAGVSESKAGVWQIKPVDKQGTNSCNAYVLGGCPLEACTSRVWHVADAGVMMEQPGIKMLVGDAAERMVGCLRPPIPPFLTRTV